MKKKAWLWLEDQPSTTEDIADIMRTLSLNIIRRFTNISSLTNFLIDRKEKEPSFWNSLGLILDVIHTGEIFIVCPPQWCEGSKHEYFETSRGYMAGLVFYEVFFLDKRPKHIIRKPPPVIFLTVLHTSFEDTEQRLTRIKNKWAKEYNIPTEEAKVEWIRKWDTRDLKGVLGKWKEIQGK